MSSTQLRPYVAHQALRKQSAETRPKVPRLPGHGLWFLRVQGSGWCDDQLKTSLAARHSLYCRWIVRRKETTIRLHALWEAVTQAVFLYYVLSDCHLGVSEWGSHYWIYTCMHIYLLMYLHTVYIILCVHRPIYSCEHYVEIIKYIFPATHYTPAQYAVACVGLPCT